MLSSSLLVTCFGNSVSFAEVEAEVEAEILAKISSLCSTLTAVLVALWCALANLALSCPRYLDGLQSMSNLYIS